MINWFKKNDNTETNKLELENNINIKKLVLENKQDKLNLLKSEFEMSTFFNIVPAFVGIATTEQFTKISKYFSDSLGYTETEILSTPFLSLIHPDDIESTLDIIKYAQAGNVIVNYENRYLKKGGGHVLIRWQAILIGDTFYVAGSDSTIEKELNNTIKENADKFQRLFENSSVPMCIFDRELYEFSDANNSFCKELGYTKENLPRFKDIIHPDDYLPSVSTAKEEASSSSPITQYENRYIDKNGNVRHIVWESSMGRDRFVYCTANFKK